MASFLRRAGWQPNGAGKEKLEAGGHRLVRDISDAFHHVSSRARERTWKTTGVQRQQECREGEKLEGLFHKGESMIAAPAESSRGTGLEKQRQFVAIVGKVCLCK